MAKAYAGAYMFWWGTDDFGDGNNSLVLLNDGNGSTPPRWGRSATAAVMYDQTQHALGRHPRHLNRSPTPTASNNPAPLH